MVYFWNAMLDTFCLVSRSILVLWGHIKWSKIYYLYYKRGHHLLHGVYWRKNVKGLYADNLLTTKIHVDIFWQLSTKSISHVYCFLDVSIHWTTYWNVLRKRNKTLNHISENFTIFLAILMSLSLSPLLADAIFGNKKIMVDMP